MSETSNDVPRHPRLLDLNHIKSYAIMVVGVGIVVSIYYLFTGFGPISGPPGRDFGGPRPGPGPFLQPGGALFGFNLWPLWGSLVTPSLTQISFGLVLLAGFGTVAYGLRRNNSNLPRLPLLVLLGVVFMIGTNLIQGWNSIVSSIGGSSELLADAVRILNPIQFIASFNSIQGTLSVHAVTQPPGAVLTMYVFYLLFESPGAIAIGLSVICSVASVFFVRGIYRRLLDPEASRYGSFLYLLLPAVQVYYLANIYAVVATLVAGTVYFYLQPGVKARLVGCIVCLFLGTFISFLFAYVVLLLLVFEMLQTGFGLSEGVVAWLRRTLFSLRYLAVVCAVVGLAYVFLLVSLGFNYVQAFLYATASENPGGAMILSNFGQYVVTRAEDILDIVVFLGPVLTVLAYRGAKILRADLSKDPASKKQYSLFLSSLVALLLLFLTGAPKKGETARICMFVLPFVLIPVLVYMDRSGMGRREKITLLVLVFVQVVIMQLFGTYIW